MVEENDRLQKHVSQLVCENGYMKQQLRTVSVCSSLSNLPFTCFVVLCWFFGACCLSIYISQLVLRWHNITNHSGRSVFRASIWDVCRTFGIIWLIHLIFLPWCYTTQLTLLPFALDCVSVSFPCFSGSICTAPHLTFQEYLQHFRVFPTDLMLLFSLQKN